MRGDLVVHGMHGENIVCRWGMGGQEDDGVFDEEGRHHIDEAWRKARRTRLVGEVGERDVDRSMLSKEDQLVFVSF